MTHASSTCGAGSSKSLLWDSPGGWGGVGGGVQHWGTHVHLWLIHIDVWQKLLPYYKVIILQLKLISFFKKEKKRMKRNEWREEP